MPKIVDHDERRRVIVEALWRVVARDGAHEVSVRHVAAEAGMPKSSIGHYVGTMPQLMGLAVDQLVQENTDFIVSLDLLDLDAGKATEVLYALVPVPTQVRRFWALATDGRSAPGRKRYVSLENMLLLFIDHLFPGCEVLERVIPRPPFSVV